MNNQQRKKEPWRIVVGVISIAYIAYMWISKDVMAIYETMPEDQYFSLIATTVLVSLAKVAAIAGAILLIKWIVDRTKQNPD